MQPVSPTYPLIKISTEYMYTTGKYKFTYAVDGGYDTTAVRRNGDVNALRAESGLYGKIKSGLAFSLFHW